MNIRSLRARLERLQADAGERYIIGQDRDRDRKRRQELFRLKLNPGLTDAQTAEMVKLDAFYEIEDRDRRRERELFYRQLMSRHSGGPALTDEERKEHAELRDRYPPDPENSRFRERYRELAARLRAIAGDTAADGARNKFESERERAPAEVEEYVTSEANRAAATGRLAPKSLSGDFRPDCRVF